MRYELANRSSWHPFTQLMKQFEDEFFTPTAAFGNAPSIASPRMEWQENDNAYLLSFDGPGMRPEDIKIDFRNNALNITAERKQNSERKEGDSLRSEKFYGMYSRTIELPGDVDADNVQADYNNGVLEVLVPKSEKTQAKNIQIGREGKISEKFLSSSRQKTVGSSHSQEKSKVTAEKASSH